MLRDHSPSAPSGAEIFFPTVGRCDPSRTARCAFGQCVQASDGDQAGKAVLRDGQIVHHPGDQIAGLAIDYGFRLIILARDDWQATRGSFVNHFGDPSQIEGKGKTSARWRPSAIGLAKTEDADAKACRVQASYDFPGVGHLRVGKSLVSKAVYQDANGVHAHLAGQRRSDRRNAAMLSGNPGS